jgi:hypothetical protein
MHTHTSPDGAGRQGLRFAGLTICVPEAEIAQSFPLYDYKAILRSQIHKQTTPLGRMTPSTEVPKHARPFPGWLLLVYVIPRHSR